MSKKAKKYKGPMLRRAAVSGGGGKTLLIVTEGEATEPNYLNGLRNHLRLSAADIEVVNADGTDPLTIVDHVIDKRKVRQQQARRGEAVKYDEVWAVFDTERADTNPKLHDALQKARANKINIALSNPCFEFWMLLHHEYTTASFAKCRDVIHRLKDRHIPDYEKSNYAVDSLIPRIPDAVDHAEQCRAHHEACGGDRNPSSDMDLLAREMNEATRRHFRIKLKDRADAE